MAARKTKLNKFQSRKEM